MHSTPPTPSTRNDLGNNETLSRGVFPQPDGTWLAMGFSFSRTFKTKRGALMWFRAACPGVDPTEAYRVLNGQVSL